MFLLTNYEEVYWNEIQEGRRALAALLRELEIHHVKVSSVDDTFSIKEAQDKLLKAINNGRSNIHETIYKMVLDQET